MGSRPFDRAVRALLFDLDGVLVGSRPLWFALMDDLARDLGRPGISKELFDQTWGQSVEADTEAFFPGHSPAEIARFYDDYFRRYAHLLETAPEAEAVLGRLAASRVATAVVTNTPRRIAQTMLDASRLRPNALVAGDDVRYAKPAPDVVLKACQVLAVPADNCVLIGDSLFDREAAKGAGVFFVGLRIDGDLRVQNLTELVELLAA